MTLDMQKQVELGSRSGSNGQDHETVFVDQFIDGILDPAKPMLGPVRDGGHIVANTAPGCWGPMITPEIRGGQYEHVVPELHQQCRSRRSSRFLMRDRCDSRSGY